MKPDTLFSIFISRLMTLQLLSHRHGVLQAHMAMQADSSAEEDDDE